jgi:hypothetical protein
MSPILKVPLPWGCDNDHNGNTCERLSGPLYKYLMVPFVGATIFLILGLMIFCLVSVYMKVRKLRNLFGIEKQDDDLDKSQTRAREGENQQQLQQRQEDLNGAQQEPPLPHEFKNNVTNIGTLQHRSRLMERSKNGSKNGSKGSHLNSLRDDHYVANKVIAIQALIYITLFSITVTIPIIRILIIYNPHMPVLNLHRFQLVVQPLQGFFNFLIFFGFKVYYQKTLNPTITVTKVVKQLFFERTADPIFISRITIIQEADGSVKRVRVANELLSIDSGSMGHMNNMDDSALSISESGAGISSAALSSSVLGAERSSNGLSDWDLSRGSHAQEEDSFEDDDTRPNLSTASTVKASQKSIRY